MIEVEVYLRSVVTGERTLIGHAVIANDGTGTAEVGSYCGSFWENTRKDVCIPSRVREFRRMERNVWDLILEALVGRKAR